MAIKCILKKIQDNSVEYGIYNYCGETECSWYEFANNIFLVADKCNFKIPKKIKPINTDEFQAKAKRPKYSVLNCSKFLKNFDIPLSNVKSGIKSTINALS
jgi:dTDP-4-dehydrorhamnose reductase